MLFPLVLDSSGSSDHIHRLLDDDGVRTDIYEQRAQARLEHLAKARLRIRDTHLHAERLLAAMLRFAPCERGRRYVACAVCACESNAACADLASDWLWFFLMPLKCAHKLDEADFSECSTPSDDGLRSEPDSEAAALSRYKKFNKQVSERDGARCIVSSKLRLRAEATHILKRASALHVDTGGNAPISTSEPIAWEILHHYADIPAEMVEDWIERIDAPENGIMLDFITRQMYDNFEWCLDEIGENRYQVRRLAVSQPLLLDLRGEFSIEFRDHSGTGIALPDPRHVRAHAAIAQVLHDQRTGEYLDEVLSTLIPDMSLVQPGKFADSSDFLIRNDLLHLATDGNIHQLAAGGAGGS